MAAITTLKRGPHACWCSQMHEFQGHHCSTSVGGVNAPAHLPIYCSAVRPIAMSHACDPLGLVMHLSSQLADDLKSQAKITLAGEQLL